MKLGLDQLVLEPRKEDYACSFCGKTPIKSKSALSRHENSCEKNPAARNCSTCGNAGYVSFRLDSYDGECPHMPRNHEGDYIYIDGCVYWYRRKRD
jgi:hypothetical protein